MQTNSSSLAYLFSLEKFGVKLGLNNIKTLCKQLGHPEKEFISLIIAGTNGKGSVAAIIETALRSAGYSTGLFTSPHLSRVEERFVVNGEPISEEILALEIEKLQKIIHLLQHNGELETPPTFFEATTAIAMSLFRNSGVQVAVFEVGMGGRFDATNVVTPVAAAITSIDLDHQEFLGSTLEVIAFEKAGVIKRGMFVVVGNVKSPAFHVLRKVSLENGTRLIKSSDVTTRMTMQDGLINLTLNTPFHNYGPLLLSLRGRHQVGNATVAVRLLEELHTCNLPVSTSAIIDGLTKTVWPGRLDLYRGNGSRVVLLDAAHNVAATTALAEYLNEVYPAGVGLVFSAFRDKDVKGMISSLKDVIKQVTCVPLKNPRAHNLTELSAIVRNVDSRLPVSVAESPGSALDIAWRHEQHLCATGSLYLIGELIDELKTNKTNRALTPIPR